MTEKELKKLSRTELLELLLMQTRENERLRKRLGELEAVLSERNLRIKNAGDLAHAVLEFNGVMEAVQASAQQYLDNIAAMEAETRAECDRLLAEARAKAASVQQRETIHDDDLIREIYQLLNGGLR